MNLTQALATVAQHPEKFRADFADWLADNWQVFEYFAHSANAVWSHGWRRYSARTIVEVMRHRTAVREIGDGTWKLNNNRTPDMAKLYLLLNQDKVGLFELRERKAA